MAYIIDGNNLMGQTPGWHRDKAGARRRLLDQIANFARRKKARMTVVFDGRPEQGRGQIYSYRGLRVMHAEQGSDADTQIEKLVESSRDPRGLTVVTSDRQLIFQVRTRNAATMRSGEFRRLMEQDGLRSPDEEEKESPDMEDANAWLRYFGVDGNDDS